MGILERIPNIIITIGCGITFLMAVEQLSGINRNRINHLSFSLLFCNAIIIFGSGLAANDVHLEYPYLIFFLLTSPRDA